MCALTFLNYVGALAFGFVYDDQPVIVHNAVLGSWSSLLGDLHPTHSASPAPTIYRPFMALWLQINHALFGVNPLGWHLSSLICHVFVTYLVFLLVWKLTKDRSTAFIAGILFGLHPAHVENVVWLSAASDLFISAMLLGSFLGFLKARMLRKNHWLILSLVLFALGMLTKETAVVFPALILAYVLILDPEVLSEPRSLWAALGASARESAPYFALAFALAITRILMFRGMPGSLVPLAWTTMILTWPEVLWFDVRHLAMPIHTSEFYSLPYVTAPGFMSFVLPILLLIVVVAAAIFWISRLRQARLAAFSALWIFLPLVPTMYLRGIASAEFVHDRFLYLPSVGFVLLLALTIRELPEKLSRGHKTAMQWSMVILLGAAAFATTIAEQQYWASDILLYQRGLETAPDNNNVRDNLADALSGAGQMDRAIPLYMEVLRRQPGFWRSNYNLAFAYYKSGNLPLAEEYFNRAIQIDNTDPDQYIYLARTQMRRGELKEAAENAGRAIARSPSSPGFHLIMGVILEAQGNRTQAISELKLELTNNPRNAVAMGELERLQSMH